MSTYPLRLRAGQPRKSAEQNRQSDASRQRRFRERRREELSRLRIKKRLCKVAHPKGVEPLTF